MKYLLIPDKFKGSLSSREVITALSKGIHRADPDPEIFSAIVSDGGDGFIDSVAVSTGAEKVACKTLDPLSRPIEASYLFDPGTKSAYIEMAQTAGLELLRYSERSPLNTSTMGTGIQISDAIAKGAVNIYVGLGGSATNDAGMGIAEALGYQFLDKNGEQLKPVGENLIRVSKIIKPEKELIGEHSIYAINDVNNPLFGPEGAAYTYAAQKGANAEEIELLDTGLKHLHSVVTREFDSSEAHSPGSGAAGGTAYGLMTFLGARFISGASFVFDLAGIPELLKNQDLDLIITGEGKIDDQTLRGKLIFGILELGRNNSVPVVAVCGSLQTDGELLREKGLKDVLEVGNPSRSLAYNMENAASLVEESICKYMLREIPN